MTTERSVRISETIYSVGTLDIDAVTTADPSKVIGTVVIATDTSSGGGGSIDSLIKDGSGTLVLSGSNNFSGVTTVTNGTLEISNSTLELTSTTTIDNGLSGSDEIITGTGQLSNPNDILSIAG